MKNRILPVLFFLLTMSCIQGQINMDLSDDLEIESNSWIVFNPGSYTIPDVGNDGLIQIHDKENIVLDGTDVFVDGEDFSGYMIKISNSSNIEIKNFGGVSHYYYAVYITNSDHIIIENNDFSYNKVDSAGWISIWTNYTQALGGGVMMYMTEYGQVNNNSMKYQNDGVALYHCDSISVKNNDFAWNTSYGIRMYFTDQCNVQNNVANHINRPYTNPSDCAAILLIVSNNNYVVDNDFSYSGDGIFLGQYQYSQIVNNNYFAYNECSYSPHNAIEATFADGNVFEYNNCNYSHYGLWLGYSFNSVIRGNEIIGNQNAGIAIDRGYNNQIFENEIISNPTGIDLWEGDGISPYQNQNSGDYSIQNNLIDGNTVAISLRETEHAIIEENEFFTNRNGIYISGDAENDTITSNIFSHTAVYHMENTSSWDIQATNNDFLVSDEAMIACNIYDKEDNPGVGEVLWQPYSPGSEPLFMTEIPEDMAEPEMVWYVYPEACWAYGLSEPTTVEWDTQEKVMGLASVHVSTGNGWDLGVLFRPDQDRYALWNLDELDTLSFSLKSENTTGFGFQYCSVILGNDCGGYYKYSASAATVLNPTMGQWQEIKIPLPGVYPWSRTAFGNISFDEISYIEIHADTWEYGFELWIDAVTFKGDLISSSDQPAAVNGSAEIQSIQPNPAHNHATVSFVLKDRTKVRFELFDLSGKKISIQETPILPSGSHQITLETRSLENGIYTIRMINQQATFIKKIVVNH